MTEKQSKIFGYLGSALSILMYVSYIPQIMGNLSGHKTSFVQPLVAAINCTIWVIYGLFKKNKDLPIIFANLPGIVFGLIATVTAL
ncbi:Sugar efflux transporter for intercellular exchange [Fusobacterium nucleatum]|uniref:SemiSWEET family transporter n=1 Tax=Fusobacterium nucleatum TaxID=851 RepID=UPI00195742C2|nr:SemiSWEET family transporter [Fusobacterium nucleatum]BEO94348.1 SemiSWEET family transporter [Fusobacterium nucleatum]BEP05202.1 SemiSWEET family transporter [Fusobacterium nucleatum]VTX49210.1 Sugar efflux transporter for intercellular exchange [Fusobacterium nucleatum]